jgi:hypothetical protein
MKAGAISAADMKWNHDAISFCHQRSSRSWRAQVRHASIGILDAAHTPELSDIAKMFLNFAF